MKLLCIFGACIIALLVLDFGSIVASDNTIEVYNKYESSAPLTRKKRSLFAAIAAGVGISTQIVSIVDYATDGEAFYPSIGAAREDIKRIHQYLMDNQPAVEKLHQDLLAVTDTYDRAAAAWRTFQDTDVELVKLFSHEAVRKQLEPGEKLGHEISLFLEGKEVRLDITKALEASNPLYQDVLFGVFQGLGFVMNFFALNAAIQSLARSQIFLSDIDGVAISEAAGIFGPDGKTISLSKLQTDTRVVSIMDKQGKVQGYELSEAQNSRLGRVKVVMDNNGNQKTVKTFGAKYFRGFKKAFKQTIGTCGSECQTKFDPNGKVINKSIQRAKYLSGALSFVAIGMSAYSLTAMFIGRAEEARNIKKEAIKWRGYEAKLRNFLKEDGPLYGNISIYQNQLDALSGSVRYLLETKSSETCEVNTNNLLAVLREVNHDKKQMIDKLVTFTKDYDHCKNLITNPDLWADKNGSWIYDKLVTNPSGPNMNFTHMKYHVLRLLKEAGKANFEWNNWEPSPGLEGQCTPSCGIIQRKMVRTCKKGECFGVDRVMEPCDGQIYNKSLLENCAFSKNNEERLKLGTFLPTICKVHQAPRIDSYFHIVANSPNSEFFLTINASDPRSLILSTYTGDDNQLWKMEDDTLVCKYFGRKIGPFDEHWKFQNDGTIRPDEDKSKKLVINILNSTNSLDYESIDQWRQEELRTTTSPPTTTTTTTASTTKGKPNPQTITEFLNLINLSDLLPKFIEKGIILSQLPMLVKPGLRKMFFEDLGFGNNYLDNSRKKLIIWAVREYLLQP